MRRPVITVAGQVVTQERIDPTGKPVEDGWPLQHREAIGDSLHMSGILEPEEGILEPAIPQAALVHLAGEPLVAVDVDLQREGEPGLHATAEKPIPFIS